jgi:Fe-S cluster assembly protein SufD
MAAVAERYESLVAAFEGLRRDRNGADPVASQREAAFERFLATGFPSTRDEEWRFTNVGPIAETAFLRATPASPVLALVDPFLIPGTAAQVVLVNGRVSGELSSFGELPTGVTIRTAADRPQAPGLKPQASAFADLNTAFAEDEVTIDIAPKAIVTDPIHILSISVANGTPALVAPRLHIHVGEAAQASIVESYGGLGAGKTLTTAVTNVTLAPGAILDHVKVQRENDDAFHLAALDVHLARASTFTSIALTFGGRIARNDITATLDGEGAECTLNGLYVASGHSLVDTHTVIDHAKAHCPSHEVYKGILGGHARAVFNGKIIVRQDAQKTNAKQTNKALLLTDDAQVNTKPQLEIFADDVKCTHGAAIGQLDDDALFYLRARGIALAEARALLIHAFAGQVLDGIGAAAVRDRAMALLDDKLAAM